MKGDHTKMRKMLFILAAIFGMSIVSVSTAFAECRKEPGAQCQGVQLDGAYMAYANLKQANMTGVSINRTRLIGGSSQGGDLD